ncbi:hypothetical protein [Pseudomonas sp. SO81]|uniref:hypothetical protein n=1 Tax=Pseudomonas sp. SO81 TaxID=2983246 RepID=UPI0025A4A22C|nr:hypothetical protein [Pseudomonas sp. SO81]WJN60971.1 hypothetical protein OH686_19690 [Pseudomonas sp. SO81]
MKINEKNFVVQAPIVYLLSLIALALIILALLVFFSTEKSDGRVIGVATGLFAGLIIASLQFLTQYLEQKALAEYRKHGLVEFQVNRKNTDYYRQLIRDTEVGDQIIVVGVTCNRLLEDFANSDVAGSTDLLEALSRGVEVKLLLPKISYLDKKNQSDFTNKTLEIAGKLKREYPDKFSIRYYDFEPSHSIFLAGSRCIVGPIFKNISSKDTPAITFDKGGQYIKPYLSYVDETWAGASEAYE